MTRRREFPRAQVIERILDPAYLQRLAESYREFTRGLSPTFPVPSTEWRYPPEIRNEEVKKVAADPSPRLTLEQGSVREGMASSRTFFVYVTPTGAEIPLGQCPVMKREQNMSTGRFGTPDFMQTSRYIVRGQARLKMVCLSSSFGRPRRIVHIYVDLAPELDLIEFTGVASCGRFMGRGKIDMKASVISEGGKPIDLTVEVLQQNFNYHIKQRGEHSGPRKGRSLIL